MSELARIEPAVMVVDPRTGEIAETPAQIVEIHQWVRRQRDSLMSVQRLAEQALVALSAERGQKTFRVGKHEVQVVDDVNIVWDLALLDELLNLGLPRDRYEELMGPAVFKPRARVAKQLAAANPRYAEVIGKARTDVVNGRKVTVK
jgi:hypothetical protein